MIGAVADALRVSSAEIAFDGVVDICVEEDGAEGAGFSAVSAFDALVGVYPNDAVLITVDRVCRASVHARGFSTLHADDGAVNWWIGKRRENTNCCFTRVYNTEVNVRTDQLADSTVAATLRNYNNTTDPQGGGQ